MALIAMVGSSVAATVAGILTLAKSNENLARSIEGLAAGRLVAEALLEAARLRAEAAPANPPILENTAALGENTESVKADTRAVSAIAEDLPREPCP